MSNKGKKVKVHYVGTLDDGSKFDSSLDRGQPIEFVCGAGQMIPGFDKAVETMLLNVTKDIHIPAAEAYGLYDERLVEKVPLELIPNSEDLPVGEQIFLSGPQGQIIPVTVLEKTDEYAAFDFNHQLAGKDLNFSITLVEVIG